MKRKIKTLLLALFLLFPSVIPLGCANTEEKQVNAVVLVEFTADGNDQTPPLSFSAEDKSVLNGVFGNGKVSLNNFIKANSLNKESVNSVVLETVKISKTVDWFLPKYTYDIFSGEYEETNPDGYDNRLFDGSGNLSPTGKPSAERFYREQELIYLVTASVKNGLAKDEVLRTLTVIPSKLNRLVEQNSLLWPHHGKHYTGNGDISSSYYVGDEGQVMKEAKLGNKSVNDYILIPYAFIYDGENVNITTLCHEYMHALGAPDYYSYDGNKVEGVGEFDIMSNAQTDSPNLSLSYTRWKMGWLSEGTDILPISGSGEYVLYPTDGENPVKAYKIVTSEYLTKGESFYIEYRKAGGEYSDITSSGLIIYRVNEENGYISSSGEKGNSWFGNAYGREEVFVFRFVRELFGEEYEERDEITKNGICYATVGDKDGYKTFGNADGEKNAITYSDGENSLITVTYLSENADGSVRFKVEMPEVSFSGVTLEEKIVAKDGNRHDLYFGRVDKDTTAYYVYSERKIRNPNAQKLIDGKYGEPEKVNTEFISARLPKYVGYERFVYVCYEGKAGLSEVKEYCINGIKNVKPSTVIIISVAVGILIPSLAGTVLKIKKKKKEKSNGK